VPFWFHTFALNRAEGIYTPGAARDHRYRVAMLPADFAGARVLDVGTFLELRVEYRRLDAFALDRRDERFDFVYCCGILHRVENPLGLLRVLRGRTVTGGTVLIETYGLGPEQQDGGAIAVSRPGEVYARDEFVYWAFGMPVSSGLPESPASRTSGRCTACRSPATRGSSGTWSPDRTPVRRRHDFFTSQSQTRNDQASAVSQIGDRGSRDHRAPPRPRVWPGLVARGA
jgi:hypothetical protein